MDLNSKKEQLLAMQESLVGQINHIRGQLAIVDELLQEEAQEQELVRLDFGGIDRNPSPFWNQPALDQAPPTAPTSYDNYVAVPKPEMLPLVRDNGERGDYEAPSEDCA